MQPHRAVHTAATLAAASGTSLKALMARIGHASARAALRYQHVMDGQDAEIVRYLERFGEEPPVPSIAHDEPPLVGTQWARNLDGSGDPPDNLATGKGKTGGDDGTRTHDPLRAKQVL